MIQINWSNVFYPNEKTYLCDKCANNLQMLTGNKCEKCSREYNDSFCIDCEWWKTYFKEDDPLIKNISLYKYNSFMQEFIARWKYRGDYILGKCFKHEFMKLFDIHFRETVKNAVLVPIPLSRERLYERGFNQAEMLTSFLPHEIVNSLQRVHTEKQSKKSRRERMLTINPFILCQPINKPVILVDDIYTTGRTIRHAAQLLRENGCPEIYSLTLIRG